MKECDRYAADGEGRQPIPQAALRLRGVIFVWRLCRRIEPPPGCGLLVYGNTLKPRGVEKLHWGVDFLHKKGGVANLRLRLR